MSQRNYEVIEAHDTAAIERLHKRLKKRHLEHITPSLNEVLHRLRVCFVVEDGDVVRCKVALGNNVQEVVLR